MFAIAITLLVLDLPRPHDSGNLVHSLLQQWPSYVAYLVSFVTIGILWIEHHGMMGAVRSIDRRFLERTLIFRNYSGPSGQPGVTLEQLA